MANEVHPFHQDMTSPLTTSGRIFASFRHWPTVPVSDILRLRPVFDVQVEEDRSAAVQELFHFVDTELTRRSASPGGIIPPGPRSSCEESCLEAV
ncbi:hypothetical protein ACFVYC_18510 [Pseudarthrobacter sp. NPDC058329]|uniref:hypothetical protein n=1 Tax=Pseudarthrobacter sp. NPDC058329 TaxID=3346448 RepID=UPI0036D97928